MVGVLCTVSFWIRMRSAGSISWTEILSWHVLGAIRSDLMCMLTSVEDCKQQSLLVTLIGINMLNFSFRPPASISFRLNMQLTQLDILSSLTSLICWHEQVNGMNLYKEVDRLQIQRHRRDLVFPNVGKSYQPTELLDKQSATIKSASTTARSSPENKTKSPNT